MHLTLKDGDDIMNICHTHSLHLLNNTTKEPFLAYDLLCFQLQDSYWAQPIRPGIGAWIKTMNEVEGGFMDVLD